MIRLEGALAAEAPAAVGLEAAALLAPSDPSEAPLVKGEIEVSLMYPAECPTFVGGVPRYLWWSCGCSLDGTKPGSSCSPQYS